MAGTLGATALARLAASSGVVDSILTVVALDGAGERRVAARRVALA